MSSNQENDAGADPRAGYAQRWGWHDPESCVHVPRKGLSADVVEEISWMKSESDWMALEDAMGQAQPGGSV
jgi:hypothetical protein